MLNFMRPTREKSYLRGSKNMPWNNCVAVSSVGGSPGTQLAVDFEQRVVLALHRIFSQRDGNHVADIVALGEEHFERSDPVVHQLVDVGQLVIGFHQHFAGRHVDHVGGDEGAFQIGAIHFHLLDLGFENRFVQATW